MIEDMPDHVRIESAELGGIIHVDHGVSAAPDAQLWAAIRPEKINISVERPASADNVGHGIVKEIAYLGDMSVFLVQLDSGKTVRVTQPNIYRHADERISWDQAVYIHWHSSSLVVLTA
jgi:putrescine transport system ATP-binding protein